MEQIVCGIYKITNNINGKMYIGQSNNIYRRWKEHKSKYSWYTQNNILYKAFQKYGIDNFTFEIIHECDESELNDKEVYYIQQYNTFIKSENSNGYNITLGGNGMRGFHHTEQSKLKMSNANKGVNNSNYGKPMSDYQKQLRSELFKGRKVSDLSKLKMRMAKIGIYKGEKHPLAKQVICNNKLFGCVKDCAEYYNVSYNAMLNWLNKKNNIPKYFYDLNLRYKDSDVIYEVSSNKYKPKMVVCDGVIYNNVRECAKFYNIKDSTMRSWLNGKRTMQQKFIDLGLRYYINTLEVSTDE